MDFVKNNFMYAIWFIIYFTIVFVLLGANVDAFVFTAVLYGCSIGIALSPIGEWILRLMNDVRPIHTNEEKNYLLPLFEEVYQNALEKNPKLSKNITCYIVDDNTINAFACGRNTVVVNIGAMNSLPSDELKAIISHELGHINYGHTKALLLSLVGNGIFSIALFCFRLFMRALDFISTIVGAFHGAALFIKFLLWIANLLIEIGLFIFQYLGFILLQLNSRTNEYQADNFAFEIGYGQEMISALYSLQKLGSGKMTLMQKMTASHPHIGARIERMESNYETEAII